MTDNNDNIRYCKQCLLKDMPADAYFKNLYEYIEGLDEQIKVEPLEYERRLGICKSCDSLLNGMCRLCGCFVELRAIMNTKSCPGVDRRW